MFFGDNTIFFCSKSNEGSPNTKKKGKESRKWNNGGTAKDAATLDYSSSNGSTPAVNGDNTNEVSEKDVC